MRHYGEVFEKRHEKAFKTSVHRMFFVFKITIVRSVSGHVPLCFPLWFSRPRLPGIRATDSQAEPPANILASPVSCLGGGSYTSSSWAHSDHCPEHLPCGIFQILDHKRASKRGHQQPSPTGI